VLIFNFFFSRLRVDDETLFTDSLLLLASVAG